jgi:hypothetical protein
MCNIENDNECPICKINKSQCLISLITPIPLCAVHVFASKNAESPVLIIVTHFRIIIVKLKIIYKMTAFLTLKDQVSKMPLISEY